RRNAELGARVSDRVLAAQFRRERDAYLLATGGGDPPLALQILPGNIVALGTDQGEDVVLAAVLANERRGQSQPTASLQLGRGAKHGSRQKVDFVVDDQAPVPLGEELEVQELFRLAAPVGEQLVRTQRNRTDLLLVAAILADLIGVQIRLVENFVAPLAQRADVRRKDQRLGLELRHDAEADDRLTRTTRQHDHSGTAAV